MMHPEASDDANSRASSSKRERPSREALRRVEQPVLRRESPARGHVKSRYSIESALLQASTSTGGASSSSKLPPRLPAKIDKQISLQRGSNHVLKRTSSGSFQYRPQPASSGGESDMDDSGTRRHPVPPSDIPSQSEFIKMVHVQDRKAKQKAILSESDSELVGQRPGRSRRRESADTTASVPQGLAPLPATRTGVKKPAVALTTWVRVWPSGESGLLQTEKSSLITNLGIQARDFRILESQLTREACCILCREKCIIVNLVYIRAIITTQYVLLSAPSDDRSAGFLAKMKERITGSSSPTLFGERLQEDQASEQLPFELKALEIALDELALHLDHHAKDLEASLKPAIDRLAVEVRTDNLDLMRRFKTRLVALKSTTMMVCTALEELLDDDDDMFQMNLTAKEQKELDLLQRVSFAISEDSDEGRSDDSSTDHELHVSQVEMLLDAYFTVYDNIFNRLQDLMENIADTEAVVNIKLDAHQNKLLAVQLCAQGIQMINLFAVGVGGFLTMNLAPDAPLGDAWAGGGAVPAGGGAPNIQTYLSYVIPAVMGSYIIFIILITFLVRNGVIHF